MTKVIETPYYMDKVETSDHIYIDNVNKDVIYNAFGLTIIRLKGNIGDVFKTNNRARMELEETSKSKPKYQTCSIITKGSLRYEIIRDSDGLHHVDEIRNKGFIGYQAPANIPNPPGIHTYTFLEDNTEWLCFIFANEVNLRKAELVTTPSNMEILVAGEGRFTTFIYSGKVLLNSEMLDEQTIEAPIALFDDDEGDDRKTIKALTEVTYLRVKHDRRR